MGDIHGITNAESNLEEQKKASCATGLGADCLCGTCRFREFSRREFTDCSGWEPIFLEVRLLHSGFPFQVDSMPV
jgi:hypothetical protein